MNRVFVQLASVSLLALTVTGLPAGIVGAQTQDAAAADVHALATAGDLGGMHRYMAAGGDLNRPDATGQTPLIAAVLAGDFDMTVLLVYQGADIGARTQNGLTALHAAAYVGHTKIVEHLIQHGADVNDQENRFGITPLHAAAEENNRASLALLLAAGADATKIEVSGFNAASRAGWREHWNAVDMLLRAGADCQPEDLVGAWLYEKCNAFAP